MARCIDADRFKKQLGKDGAGQQALRSGTMKAFADELTELIKKDIDKQPTVDAIPVEWIQRQRDMYPGMESAMWEKLLILWEKERTSEQLYGEAE